MELMAGTFVRQAVEGSMPLEDSCNEALGAELQVSEVIGETRRSFHLQSAA